MPQADAAHATLSRAARLTIATLATGQLAMMLTVALFYALTAARGDYIAWNKSLITGYLDNDILGNAALLAHVLAALPLLALGALQCLPRIRQRAPSFHRWNGRLFVLATIVLAAAGTLLQFLHDPRANPFQYAQQIALALVLILCAANAWHHARARDFRRHRRWALRLFVAMSSAIVIRAAFSLLTLVLAPLGAGAALTLHGPLFTVVGYAQFLLPLALLELYFAAETRPTPARLRYTTRAILIADATLALGILASCAMLYLHKLTLAFDTRPSIAETIDRTRRTRGIDAALATYTQLHAQNPAAYNFDEDELDALGYRLLHGKSYHDAIAILALNSKLFPHSANAADSLGEAYLTAGLLPEARRTYLHALTLDPTFTHAARMLTQIPPEPH